MAIVTDRLNSSAKSLIKKIIFIRKKV